MNTFGRQVNILQSITSRQSKGEKSLAVLVDPDFVQNEDAALDLAAKLNRSNVDFIFYGGSLITESRNFDLLKVLKEASDLPVVLFPSNPAQIRSEADAILFLSLISGRNSEFLIGHHVTAAPLLKNSGLEILPVGYMLVGCGTPTTAEYISGTSPMPYHKPEIAAATALAGEMLGMKMLYLDGGSGAAKPVSAEMITAVRKNSTLPLIVGGGLDTTEKVAKAYQSGADLAVVGTALEKNANFLDELREIKTSMP